MWTNKDELEIACQCKPFTASKVKGCLGNGPASLNQGPVLFQEIAGGEHTKPADDDCSMHAVATFNCNAARQAFIIVLAERRGSGRRGGGTCAQDQYVCII